VIVVDTNVVAYLVIGGDHQAAARTALRRDSGWCAPLLWRSEFRSVLAGRLRRGACAVADATTVMAQATELLDGAEFQVDTRRVLDLVAASTCSAYDCEFVALAQELGIPLVTSDAQVLNEFPDTAVALRSFGAA